MARGKVNAVLKVLDYLKDPDARMMDYQDLSVVPDVPQTPLIRPEAARGQPKALDSLRGPENAERLEQIALEGAERGGREWYNLDPLRKAFVEELGDEEGVQAFNRYADYVAATSPRGKVSENIRRSSYFYQQDRLGNQVGGLTNADLPKGYGHLAHDTHDIKLREIEEHGGLLPMNGPKVSSFAENLKGNQSPMTIDTHNYSAVSNAPNVKKSQRLQRSWT